MPSWLHARQSKFSPRVYFLLRGNPEEIFSHPKTPRLRSFLSDFESYDSKPVVLSPLA